MGILMAHIVVPEVTTLVCVFALGWLLGGVATARLLRRSGRSVRN